MKITSLLGLKMGLCMVIILMICTNIISSTTVNPYEYSDNEYLRIIQLMEVTFSDIPSEVCSTHNLILPEVSDEGITGEWSPAREIDLNNIEDSTLTVTFTPTDVSISPVSFDIVVEFPLYLGIDQSTPLLFCKDGGDIIVDLIDALDLNLTNILTLNGDGQLFSFVSGNSFNPSNFEFELRNLNLKNIPVGPYTFFVESAPLNSCLFVTQTFSLAIVEQQSGEDEFLQICQGDTDFYSFDELVKSKNNGSWEERATSNSGTDLTSSESMNLSEVSPGLYHFDYVSLGEGPCDGLRDTATLTVNILENSELLIQDSTLTICSRVNEYFFNVSLNGIPPFDFSVQLVDDKGSLSSPLLVNTSDETYTLKVQHTEGDNRIQGNTFFLNEKSQYYDILPVALQDANSVDCFDENLRGKTRITFDFEEVEVKETICQGEEFVFLNKTFNKNNPSGELYKEGLCDTLFKIDLSFFPLPEVEINREICESETVVIKGQEFSADFLSDKVTFSEDNACDTIFNISVSVISSKVTNLNYEFCEEQSVTIGNSIYNLSNPSGTENLISESGCDSVVNVTIVPQNEISSLIEQSICKGSFVNINGIDYDENNLAGQSTFISSSGCDSIVYVSIVLDSEISFTRNELICEGDFVDIHGQRFDADNLNGIIALQTSLGCDSTLFVNVEIAQNYLFQKDTLICANEFGNEVVDAEMLTDTLSLISSQGCDSVYLLNVHFLQPSSSAYEATLCTEEIVQIGDVIYDVNNPFGSNVLTASNGCDSIVHVELTYINSTEKTIFSTFCEGEELVVNGVVYDIENPFGEERIPLSNGCDSVILVDLIFNQKSKKIFDEVLCEDETLEVNGVIYDINNPSDVQTLTSANGCDSIIEIDLSFSPQDETYISESLCAGEEYIVVGNVFDINNPSGVVFMENSIGCDSVLYVDLTFSDISVDVRGKSICPNDPDGGIIIIDGIKDGTAPYSYDLDGITGDVSEFPTEISNVKAGNHDLILYDVFGCSSERRITIGQAGRVDFAIDYYKIDEGLYELELKYEGKIDSLSWETEGDISCLNCTFPTVSIDETTLVRAVVHDEDSCIRNVEVVIKYEKKIFADVANIINLSSILGNNRLFLSTDDNERITYDLLVYNRWGEVLYKAQSIEPNDPDMGWDGTEGGKRLDNGVYIYEMLIKENDKLLNIIHGDITIIN